MNKVLLLALLSTAAPETAVSTKIGTDFKADQIEEAALCIQSANANARKRTRKSVYSTAASADCVSLMMHSAFISVRAISSRDEGRVLHIRLEVGE